MGYSIKEAEPIMVSNGDTSITIEGTLLSNAALTLRAIKHPLRKQIVELIDKNGSMTVTEIFVKLRVEQSVASQHLAVLRESNWLLTERDGKFIYYSVNYPRFQQLNEVLAKLTEE